MSGLVLPWAIAAIDAPWRGRPLFEAAALWYGDVIRVLCKHGASPFDADGVGNTPLHEAARHGETGLESARALFAEVEDDCKYIRQRNHRSETPLHIAVRSARKGSCDMVRLLLMKGAYFNSCTESGVTPLMDAATSGIACVLLRAGAVVGLDAVDSHGRTPLYRAVVRGCTGAVITILSAGANPEKGCIVGPIQTTPLMAAALRGHIDCFRALVVFGAELTPQSLGLDDDASSDSPSQAYFRKWVRNAQSIPSFQHMIMIRRPSFIKAMLRRGYVDPDECTGSFAKTMAAARALSSRDPRILCVVKQAFGYRKAPNGHTLVGWTPASNALYHPQFRAAAKVLVQTAHRLRLTNTLPLLPWELWFAIMGWLSRRDF